MINLFIIIYYKIVIQYAINVSLSDRKESPKNSFKIKVSIH